MNVRELIKLLKQHPAKMRVVVDGYEGGVNDVKNISQKAIQLDRNTAWYYGTHAHCNEEEKDETALHIE